MFFRTSKPRTDISTLQEQLKGVIGALEQLRAEHDRLDLAFASFRGRVNAWRKGGADPFPQQQGGDSEPPPAPAVDKGAILRAHRSKQ